MIGMPVPLSATLNLKEDNSMKLKLKKRKCTVCGNSFQPIRSNNDKCSKLCRLEWYRESTEKRNHDRRERNKKNYVLKICRVCGTKFKAAPNRQNCSSSCSARYIKEGLGYRHFCLKNLEKKKAASKLSEPTEREIGFDLKIFESKERFNERLTIRVAMEEYRDRGGKITVLADEPDQPLPSVNFDNGWGWYAGLGAGTYTGVEEYADIPELNESDF